MTAFIAAVMAAVVGLVIIAIVRMLRRRALGTMPTELVGARLLASERKYGCRRPVPVVARVDQLLQRADGVAVLIETKRRQVRKIYDSDRLQLSVQAFTLRHSRRLGFFRYPTVADHAYVRLVGENATEFRQVRLLGDAEVIAAYKRARAVIAGRTEPKPPASRGLCVRCGFFTICEDPNVRRQREKANAVF